MAGEATTFEAAYRCARELVDAGEADVGLCHGVVTNLNGTFVHAWVERVRDGEPFVVEVSRGRREERPRERYYKVLVVKDVVRYDVDQAVGEMVQTRHYGPWDPGLVAWAGK